MKASDMGGRGGGGCGSSGVQCHYQVKKNPTILDILRYAKLQTTLLFRQFSNSNSRWSLTLVPNPSNLSFTDFKYSIVVFIYTCLCRRKSLADISANIRRLLDDVLVSALTVTDIRRLLDDMLASAEVVIRRAGVVIAVAIRCAESAVAIRDGSVGTCSTLGG